MPLTTYRPLVPRLNFRYTIPGVSITFTGRSMVIFHRRQLPLVASAEHVPCTFGDHELTSFGGPVPTTYAQEEMLPLPIPAQHDKELLLNIPYLKTEFPFSDKVENTLLRFHELLCHQHLRGTSSATLVSPPDSIAPTLWRSPCVLLGYHFFVFDGEGRRRHRTRHLSD